MGVAALILAAGEGTRMRSDVPKVAHRILGVPMVELVVGAARDAGCDRVVVVTGHCAEQVEGLVPGIACARQDRQLGTGHAVMCAEEVLAGHAGPLLVLSGDSPLIRPETLRGLVEAREAAGAAMALLTADPGDPTGYGRILRDEAGEVAGIVEQKDLAPGQGSIREVNTGFYCFDGPLLFEHLHRLETDNAQGEYYLTDMVRTFRSQGLKVVSVLTDEPEETLGVNSRVQLAEAGKALQRRVNAAHMLAGVTIVDPDLAWIAPTVTIGRDVVIEPMTFLMGATSVADRAVIGPQARITDSFVGEGAVVDASIVVGSEVGPGATVGPGAYLRPGTVLEARAKAGTSVEIKNSLLREGAKVPHLSYIGDAEIGPGANIGAGSITCNYDGFEKHRTVVGAGAFVGSDTMLVAPVSIGEGAVTGAGSSVNRDVPPGALAVERTDLRVVEGWAEKRRLARTDSDAPD